MPREKVNLLIAQAIGSIVGDPLYAAIIDDPHGNANDCDVGHVGKIFKERGGSDAPLPVRLEICSGSGDWVVAQALADAGRAHWAALELRHDRVCHIVQRALTAGAASLCVLGGDASKPVPSAGAGAGGNPA